jgi:thioredoxin-related protein
MPLPRLLTVLIAAGLLGGLLATPTDAQITIPPQSFETVLDEAQAQDKPVLVEIYAPWCPYCQRMQEDVYSDATVRKYLDETFTYVRLNSDTTAGTKHRYRDRTLSTKQLASVLGAQGVPTTTFLKPDGTPIARQPGFIERATFLKIIRYIGSGAYEQESFQSYTSSRSE